MEWPNQRGWRGWIGPAALAATITVASGRSEVASPPLIGFDKVAHFAVFGLLATLVLRNGSGRGWAWTTVALVSLFGATDEWHQSFTAGRSVQAADWIADTLGAALAVAAYTGWSRYRRLLEGGLKSRVEQPAGMPPNREIA